MLLLSNLVSKVLTETKSELQDAKLQIHTKSSEIDALKKELATLRECN